MCENEKGNGQANPEVEAAEVEAAEVEAAEVEDPMAAVQRLEPLEMERYLRFESQMKVNILMCRILDFEVLELKRSLQTKTDERMRNKAMLQNDLNVKIKPQYLAFLGELAEKYQISEPSSMLIDPELGTIRDATEV
jgi:hypothetical protein